MKTNLICVVNKFSFDISLNERFAKLMSQKIERFTAFKSEVNHQLASFAGLPFLKSALNDYKATVSVTPSINHNDTFSDISDNSRVPLKQVKHEKHLARRLSRENLSGRCLAILQGTTDVEAVKHVINRFLRRLKDQKVANQKEIELRIDIILPGLSDVLSNDDLSSPRIPLDFKRYKYLYECLETIQSYSDFGLRKNKRIQQRLTEMDVEESQEKRYTKAKIEAIKKKLKETKDTSKKRELGKQIKSLAKKNVNDARNNERNSLREQLSKNRLAADQISQIVSSLGQPSATLKKAIFVLYDGRPYLHQELRDTAIGNLKKLLNQLSEGTRIQAEKILIGHAPPSLSIQVAKGRGERLYGVGVDKYPDIYEELVLQFSNFKTHYISRLILLTLKQANTHSDQEKKF